MENKIEKKQQQWSGVIVSAKTPKTVIVRVDTSKKNSKYHKIYKVSKRFPVHDEKCQYKAGDKVSFVGCRPLSRTKRWRVIYSK